MGSKYYETPNIDRLASQGMVFTNAYAACAVCSPTRASILTGRYPARIGITDWIRGSYSNIKIPENKQNPTGYEERTDRLLLTPENPYWLEHEEVTIAEVLKTKGYVTAHIGKWHLGPSDWLPESQGFDINIGGEDYGQPPGYFDPYKRGRFSIASLPPRQKGKYLTDREGAEAVIFIRDNKDKTFYLNMCHYAVHTPLEAKEDYIKQCKDRAQLLGLEPLKSEESYIEKFRTKIPLEGQRNPTYAAMVKSVDDAVGKILKILEEHKLTDKTIIVFFSDNGGHIVSTDNTPLRLGKGHPYEGGIREPLVIKWPGKIKPGTTCDEPVSSIDFFPTFCRTAGIEIPEDQIIDGLDLTPLLEQAGSLGRQDLFWHFPHYWWGIKVKPYSIIRSGEWKLIRFYENNKLELYNLKNDISEKNNLAEKIPVKAEELNRKLTEWLKDINAKMPKENPNYEPDEIKEKN